MGIGSWAGVGVNVKRSVKGTAKLPDFKRVIYDRISKTVYSGKFSLTNLGYNYNSQISAKNILFLVVI